MAYEKVGQKEMSNKLNKKIMKFHNAGKGYDAVILTCGPSLNNYTEEQILSYCSNKVVLCVKQTIDIVPNLKSYFHFFNKSHMPSDGKYKYTQDPLLSIGSDSVTSQGLPKHDVFTKIGKMNSMKNSVCGGVKLDPYRYSVQKDKPCGPGIMFETVFFFAQHLGVRSVTMIGWDGYSKGCKKHNHFYETKQASRCTFIKEHNEAAVPGSRHIYEWLKTHNCKLQIVGESHMHKDIPRIEI